MNELISVIVPIYKTEQFLMQCVDSILNQTYRNIEVILVNDGSPDNSDKICDNYAKTDRRIITIHKQNSGLSDARNAGIDIAKGKYLCFVDSDDWIANDMLELLLNNLTARNADISSCAYYRTFVNKRIPSVRSDSSIYVLDQSEVIIASLTLNGFDCFAWNKLYKSHLFKDVRYPSGKTYEDMYVIIRILLQCKNVVVDTVCKYYYRQRKGSIVRKIYEDSEWDMIDASKQNYLLVKSLNNYFVEAAEYSIIKSYIEVLKKMVLLDDFVGISRYSEIESYFCKNKSRILQNNFFSKKELFSIHIIVTNMHLFKLVYLFHIIISKLKGKYLFE